MENFLEHKTKRREFAVNLSEYWRFNPISLRMNTVRSYTSSPVSIAHGDAVVVPLSVHLWIMHWNRVAKFPL